MKDKQEIVSNWLPRYTGLALSEFGEHILLTNFSGYLNTFSQLTGAPIVDHLAEAVRDREVVARTIAEWSANWARTQRRQTLHA